MRKRKDIFKDLVETAKEQGYITYDEINKGIPSEVPSDKDIDDFFGTLNNLGIRVVSQPKEYSIKEAVATEETETQKVSGEEEVINPVRMYLSEMAKVSLLDRATEINLARSIRENEKMLKMVVLESPLIIKEIRNWETLIIQQEMTPKELMPRGRKSYSQLRGMRNKMMN
ncbi:MAG: hypothetical protein NT145_05135 [Elusimicrobia bacterium]|nr:hypothetical protein [Elusimicrobiota bacterium]